MNLFFFDFGEFRFCVKHKAVALRFFLKCHNIYRKTPAPESVFNKVMN